jgi:PadR family transcriptional regulator PadR
MAKPTDLVQGTLDLLILKVVALEPMHGWAIAQRIRQMSSDVLRVGQSALYPALHKLERQGWIKSEWKTSDTNRRAKYYSLTRAGRKAVASDARRRLCAGTARRDSGSRGSAQGGLARRRREPRNDGFNARPHEGTMCAFTGHSTRDDSPHARAFE